MTSTGSQFSTPEISVNGYQAEAAESIYSVEPRRRFKSSRLVGKFEKPWTETKDKRARWDSYILYGFIGIGVAIGAYICYHSVAEVPKHEYCLILDDRFETIDSSVWSHEIQVGGFGTGSFDWTTDDSSNTYTTSDGLHIVPTLTLDSTNISYGEFINGYTVNLTQTKTCTTTEQRTNSDVNLSDCIVHSNATLGDIINPVRSARLTTAGKKSIKYGRVEVVAKMPKGDWLWPAIWMMPESSVYGDWPRSGEIDIAELRGNDAETYEYGNNKVDSTLHWGTASSNDQYLKTTGRFEAKRTKYSDGFHSYGLEWSEKYIFIWLDGRLRQVFFLDFGKHKSMWKYGGFAGTTVNGTAPTDPWTHTGRASTPFDENFYLILNVAVGGTNGYFPDGIGNKPWGDSSTTAMRDFWQANSTWLNSWGKGEDRGMTVKSVKMYQQGKC